MQRVDSKDFLKQFLSHLMTFIVNHPFSHNKKLIGLLGTVRG